MSGYDAPTYDCNGGKYPRVTGILNMLPAGYGLEKWKTGHIKSKFIDDYYRLLRHGDDIDPDLLLDAALAQPNKVRDALGDRGKDIHNVLEALLHPEKDHTQFTKNDPSMQPLIDNALIWIQEMNLKPVAIEERLCSDKYKYAGTVDLIAEQDYKGERQIALIDFKSGTILRKHELQLAAYAQAYSETRDSKEWPDICYVVKIDRDALTIKEGKHIHRYNPTTKRPELEDNFKVFLHQREVYRWEYGK